MQERKAGRAQKQTRGQQLVQLTMRRRESLDQLDTPSHADARPGPMPASNDLGPDDETDGDALLDDGDDSDSAEPGAGELPPPDDDEIEDRPRFALPNLLGSRPPVVLLRLECDSDHVTVRRCLSPSPRARRGSPDLVVALELLERFVQRCFESGRPHLDDAEWDQLLGRAPAPLTRRLMLLTRLAVQAKEKVSIGAEQGAGPAFTPHDLGLARFAHKFAALPDGTPFSIRLLLLDQRGRKRAEHPFDQLPDAVKFLALRRALDQERRRGVAVTDNDLRLELRQALEDLLGTSFAMPTEKHVQRLRSDLLQRNGLGHLFPNRQNRQRAYDAAEVTE